MRASDGAKGALSNSHDRQIGDTLHDTILFWLYDRMRKHPKPEVLFRKHFTKIPDNWTFDYLELEIEKPIKKAIYRDEAIIGFVDLCAKAHFKFFRQRSVLKSELDMYDDFRMVGDSPNDPRYVTIEMEETQSVYLFFEVKTAVNVGETIRQVRYYNEALVKIVPAGVSLWVVCAPPFARSDLLEEQGIKFLPYVPSH